MIKVGDRADVTRQFTQDDLLEYASLSGFEDSLQQVPEPLLAGMISDLLGTSLPGSGTMYMKQNTDFLEPAPLGKDICASVEVTRIRAEKLLVNLKTECKVVDGETVSAGEALVMFPGVAEDR